jgi:hypothetical protein
MDCGLFETDAGQLQPARPVAGFSSGFSALRRATRAMNVRRLGHAAQTTLVRCYSSELSMEMQDLAHTQNCTKASCIHRIA